MVEVLLFACKSTIISISFPIHFFNLSNIKLKIGVLFKRNLFDLHFHFVSLFQFSFMQCENTFANTIENLLLISFTSLFEINISNIFHIIRQFNDHVIFCELFLCANLYFLYFGFISRILPFHIA